MNAKKKEHFYPVYYFSSYITWHLSAIMNLMATFKIFGSCFALYADLEVVVNIANCGILYLNHVKSVQIYVFLLTLKS